MGFIRIALSIALEVAPSLIALTAGLFSVWARQHFVFLLMGCIATQSGVIVLKRRRQLSQYLSQIRARRKLTSHSQVLLAQIVREIRGIPKPLEREKAKIVRKLVLLGQKVLLVGEAGTGKTGIVYEVAQDLDGRPLVFLDARDLYRCRTFDDVSRRLGIYPEDIVSCLRAWGKRKRAVLVLDQCDSVRRTEAEDVLLDLIRNLAPEPRLGVVLVVRPKEGRGFLELLRGGEGYITREVTVDPILLETAGTLLRKIGVESPPPGLVQLATNLLDLSLIADLVAEAGSESVRDVMNQTGLWDKYVESLDSREGTTRERDPSVRKRATELAIECLKCPTKTCELGSPLCREENRLLSRSVLVEDLGERYRFRHEEFRDYLFARHAVYQKGWMLAEIEQALGSETGRVVHWVQRLYQELDPSLAAQFFLEVMQ